MFNEIENWVKGQKLVYGFADLVCGSGVWVSGFRNCVTSNNFVCKQLKKTVNLCQLYAFCVRATRSVGCCANCVKSLGKLLKVLKKLS